LGFDLVREVPDDLAIPDEQQVVGDRHGGEDSGEECPHVLIAVALTGRVILGRRPPG
jgi:hypothetical protein